ncbi:MAG: hypothetical protein EXX96DRAFT_588047 [Benjaminiella poitrasii]|nr:MAG: hypothetical protein EXX96DRAFT_588047 [Benjaminiella poitrasii]
MSTLIIDKDYNDDIIHLNEDPLYGSYSSPFAMDELYPHHEQKGALLSTDNAARSLFDDRSEEEFEFNIRPQAPPPSPQAQPMLDMIFASKLNDAIASACSKEIITTATATLPASRVATATGPVFCFEQHAEALDRLLRKTLKKNGNGNIIKQRRQRQSCSLRIRPMNNNQEPSLTSPSWQTRAKNQKMEFIIQATENTEKLKSAIMKKSHTILDDKEEEEKIINDLRDMGL